MAPSPSSALASSRSRTLARLRRVIAAAFALPLVALVVIAAILYRQTFENAERQLDAASRIVHEHALKMLETNEMLLARMLDLMGTASDAQLIARGPEIHARLREMARELPQVQGLFLHSADGRSLGNSLVFPVPRDIDYSDREWYRAHREGSGSPVFITEQLRSRVSGEPFFDMSRRRSLGGRFAGTANVSLRPEYLTAFWEEMAKTESGLRVVLLRADGRLIARWPGGVPGGPALSPDTPMMAQIASGASRGHFQTASPIDGATRLVAYRKLVDYPLYVTASFGRSDVLRAWAARVGWIALVAIPLACALAWMAALALRRTREELDAVQRLEDETALRQRSELALAQAQKLETVGQLAGGVAHDFNNLMMIVGSNLHLLRHRVPAGAAERELAAIERTIASGTRLTRQLLSLSGRQALAPERLHLQERLPAVISLLRPALPAAIEITAEAAPDTAPIVADAAELELALINLALNARDAMPDGGRISISAANQAERVVIDVEDNGGGIDPAILERIREPFFTTKRAGKGSGLGLTQVQSFCSGAGGTLDIRSRPGSGTRVRLSFPGALAGATEIIGDAPPRPAQLRCRLLLVEDNDALASATAAVLASFGCEVTRADHARSALDATEKQRFDVVLTDIEMPGRMDGIELAARLTARRPPLPVVLMSGYAARIEQAKALNLNVLAKPCSASVLRNAIAAALERSAVAA